MGRPLSILLATSLCVASVSSYDGKCTADEKNDEDVAYCAGDQFVQDPVACQADPKCHWSIPSELREALARVIRPAEHGINDCSQDPPTDPCYGPCVLETDTTTEHCPLDWFPLPVKMAPRVHCEDKPCPLPSKKFSGHMRHKCKKYYKYQCMRKLKKVLKKSKKSISASEQSRSKTEQSRSKTASVVIKRPPRDGHLYLGENLDGKLQRAPTSEQISAELEANGRGIFLEESHYQKLEESAANKKNWKLTLPQIKALENWQSDNDLAVAARKNWWDAKQKKMNFPTISAGIYGATHSKASMQWLSNPPRDLTLYFGMEPQSKSGYLGEGTIFGPVSTSEKAKTAIGFANGGAVIQINIKKGQSVRDSIGGIVNIQWIGQPGEKEWLLWNVNLDICNFYYDKRTGYDAPAAIDKTNPFYRAGKSEESKDSMLGQLKQVPLSHQVGAHIGGDNSYDFVFYSEMEPNVMEHNDIYYSYFMITFIISAIFCMVYISWTAFIGVSCFLFGRLQGMKSDEVDTSQSCV